MLRQAWLIQPMHFPNIRTIKDRGRDSDGLLKLSFSADIATSF